MKASKRMAVSSETAIGCAVLGLFTLLSLVLPLALGLFAAPASAEVKAGSIECYRKPCLPHYAPEKHLGVGTCAGAPCHSAENEADLRKGSNIYQNEYFIWAEEDRHSKRAYGVLLNKESKQIAKNLGLPKPAHESDLCLACHADNVPASRRGKGNDFRIQDGVGCEGCHGGAERYMESHQAGNPHKKNIELGMYPTDEPVARARLCLSCHFGDRNKFVDHRLMGAGHPRQSFELAFFSLLQPYHWDPDDDYIARGKVFTQDVKLWAIGQAVAIDEILDAMLDPNRNKLGLFPEFVLYDCHACHHPMSNTRWRPRPSTGLGPGVARLNDANFLMLMEAASVVDKAASDQLRKDLRRLHRAASDGIGDPTAIAKQIRGHIATLLPELEKWKLDKKSLRQITASVLAAAERGEFVDYAGAEQAAMALQVLVYDYYNLRLINDATYDALAAGELARLLQAVDNPDKFKPLDAQKRFGQLAKKLKGV